MKTAFKLFVVILFSFFSVIFSFAQNDKPLRVEIEAKSNSDSYNIIPFGEKGIILFFQGNENADLPTRQAGKTNNKWYFTLYDTNLKEVWTKEYPVRKDQKFMYFDYSSDFLYLYLENNTSAYAKGDFQVLKLDVDKASVQTFNAVIPIKSTILGFNVINDVVMLAGRTIPTRASYWAQTFLSFTLLPWITGLNVNKYQPFLFTFNLSSGATKMVSDTFHGQAYVETLSVDDATKTFAATIKNHIPRKTNAMYIEEFNTNGTKTSSLKLETNNEKRKLNTGKIVSVNENDKILIGTYNNITKGNRANPAFAGFSEGSSGIYFTRIINGKQKFITFYNFSKFKNFYSYISERRAAKMAKKARKEELQGKELSFDYKLLVHDIIKRDSSYIMIAEAYYPEYQTINYTSFDSYGRPITVSYTVFEGYRYTNAIIACFNNKGELLWDNSFEIWNILTFNLRERVKVLLDVDDIMLAYSNEGSIASKIIHGDKVIEGKQYTKIETNYTNDKLISDYNSDMEYWYGDYFISYGYQNIKNVMQNKSKRTVFYFNKIAFQ
jgi:hypothetical protein